MKKITQKILLTLLAAVFCFGIAACSKRYKPMLNSQQGVNFRVTTLAMAKETAKTENKPLLVFLHATWCPTCKRMENEVFVQKDLGNIYNQQLINVAIDYDSAEGHKLNELYPIRATPTLFFFNPDGTLAQKLEGFQTVDELLNEENQLRK
jgi:thioredoxin 1